MFKKLLLAGAFVLPLLAGAEASAGGAGTLTIGLSQYPPSLNPNTDSSVAATYVLSMSNRPLTSNDPKWNAVCVLCTELPTLENGLAKLETTPEGKPGMAVTFQLQPKATWGDGTPVTSADVVFTWEVGKHPDSGAVDAEGFKEIWKIDVIDDKTFTFHLDKVTYEFASYTTLHLLPQHIEKPIFEADPKTYRERTAFDADTTNPGLYWGPYRIVKTDPGAEIVLEPNPTWYGAEPAFDRIVVRTIENTAALQANLLSGAVDMVAGELGFTLDQGLAFAETHGKKYNVIFQPGLVYEHIDLNLSNPILADQRVRQALLYSADRKTLTEELFQGKQPVADSFVHPLDGVTSPKAVHYGHDPEKAAALLEEAGWKAGPDGIRVNDKGEKLALVFQTTAGNRTRELVQQFLQDGWKKLGIEITIENQPARLFFGETTTQRKFPGLAMFAWLSSPEDAPETILKSQYIPAEANGWAGQNYTGYANPEMDFLIDALEAELAQEKRLPIWAEIQRIYSEDLPVLPLYYRADTFVLPLWLEGVTPTGHLGPSTLWIENWKRKS